MKSKLSPFIFTVVCGLILMGFTTQNPGFNKLTDPTELKKGIKRNSLQTQALTADFKQTKHMAIMKYPFISKGRLTVKKPDKIKWQYTQPFNYAVVILEDQIHIDDNGKVNNIDLSGSKSFRQMSHMIRGSVQGDILDEKEFDITYWENKDFYQAILVPKDDQLKKYIPKLKVTIAKIGFQVSELVLYETQNDYTAIAFYNHNLNPEINDADFRLD